MTNISVMAQVAKDSSHLTLLDSNKQTNNLLFKTMDFISTDSGIITNRYKRSSCKGYTITSEFDPYLGYTIHEKVKQTELPKVSFLTVHGNIAYDFYYRSKIDTPFAQQDLQEHTERVYLNALVEGKYPIKVGFTARQSNSPYFSNFYGVNFQFDKYTYNKNLKQDLINRLSTKLMDRPDFDTVNYNLQKYTAQYDALKNWTESPSTLQKIIEERERSYNKQLSMKDYSNLNTPNLNPPSVPKIDIPDSYNKFKFKDSDTSSSQLKKVDSTAGKYIEIYDKAKRDLDTLSQKIQILQRRADSIENVAQNNLAAAKQKVYAAKDETQLQKIALDYGIQSDKDSKLQKQLSAIRNFSIGKCILNYTELTAQNITLTGVNVEYNPSYYAAFAAGKIDYNFHDFFSTNTVPKSTGQYLLLGRYGFGNIDKEAIIFTLFEGKKNLSQYTSDSVTNYVNILGYSIQGIYKINKNTIVSAEFAKSTKPVTGNLTIHSSDQTKVLWSYGDKSNMGINLKAETVIPHTKTKLSGFYRTSGQNFQSFSLFSYNTDQTAWQAKAEQPFLKNKISVIGMLRRNDFTNPLIDQTYKTSTIFKSIQVNVHFPKYPSLSVGFYPGTQLYVVNNQQLSQSVYYILNGSLVYSYFYKHIGMNSSFIYNRYFNHATDSGIVLYQGVNYYASQTLFFGKLQLQGGYAYNKQPELDYYTIEASADYALNSWLKLGAGIKDNQVANGADYFGGSGQITADFKKLGGFQFQYDKSFLPTTSQTLYPIETGRISWYKYF
jgi:hypothetical protein